jgi:hypothetical protein
MKYLKASFLILAMTTAWWSAPATADDPIDSSADAANHFLRDVQSSRGVILRVPINERGEEYAPEATMRIVPDSTDSVTATDLLTTWENSKPLDESLQLSADSPTDSSTWGWYGWRGGSSWYRPYYYSSYSPSAYYYGSRYSYSPYYHSSYYSGRYYGGSYYGGSGYYGHRYYYYDCDYY